MVSPSPSPAPAGPPLKRSESPLFFEEEREDEVEDERVVGSSSAARRSSPIKMEVDDDVDELMDDVPQEEQEDEEDVKPSVAGPSSNGANGKTVVSFKREAEVDEDEILYLSGTTPKKTAQAGVKRKVVDSDDDQAEDVIMRRESASARAQVEVESRGRGAQADSRLVPSSSVVVRVQGQSARTTTTTDREGDCPTTAQGGRLHWRDGRPGHVHGYVPCFRADRGELARRADDRSSPSSRPSQSAARVT